MGSSVPPQRQLSASLTPGGLQGLPSCSESSVAHSKGRGGTSRVPQVSRCYSSKQTPSYGGGTELRNDNPVPMLSCSMRLTQWENVGTGACYAQRWRALGSPVLCSSRHPYLHPPDQHRPEDPTAAPSTRQWCFLPFTRGARVCLCQHLTRHLPGHPSANAVPTVRGC